MTLSTVLSTRRTPQPGEIPILNQRKLTLYSILDIYGRSMSDEAVQEVYNELAEVENALQRYDGTMEETDHAEEINFARYGN